MQHSVVLYTYIPILSIIVSEGIRGYNNKMLEGTKSIVGIRSQIPHTWLGSIINSFTSHRYSYMYVYTSLELNYPCSYQFECFMCRLTLLACALQMDPKGLPSFLSMQVMRRHHLAIHYIQKHFTSPSLESSAVCSSYPSLSSSTFIRSQRPYEDTVPVNYFTSKKEEFCDKKK